MGEIYEYGNRALKWSQILSHFTENISFNTRSKAFNTISLTRLDDERDYAEDGSVAAHDD